MASLGGSAPGVVDGNLSAGDCIFVDHTTGFVLIEHMINFTSTETIQAKCHFEQKMMDMGIFVQAYQSDNGIFDAADFLEEINKELQSITFSKVGAHHQNVIAKWGIQSILTKTWMLLIHAVICWPAISDTSLWQMAVDYALHHHNHMPQDMMSPLDLLLKTQSPQSHFKDMQIWGCLCYVLDPMLQGGHKLPKWKPQSHHGIIVGFSPHHSSLVPLV